MRSLAGVDPPRALPTGQAACIYCAGSLPGGPGTVNRGPDTPQPWPLEGPRRASDSNGAKTTNLARSPGFAGSELLETRLRPSDSRRPIRDRLSRTETRGIDSLRPNSL